MHPRRTVSSPLGFHCPPPGPPGTSASWRAGAPPPWSDLLPAHRNLEGRWEKAITKSGLQHLAPPPPTPGALCSEPERQIRSTVDWSESATYGEHIWFETNVSGDFCYVGEQYCVAKMLKSVSRRKCAACKIVVHTPCIEQLEKVRVRAQPFPPKASCTHTCVSLHAYSRYTPHLPRASQAAWWCRAKDPGAEMPAFESCLPPFYLPYPHCPEQAWHRVGLTDCQWDE